MAIKAEFSAESAEQIRMSLTVSMTLEEWVQVRHNILPEERDYWHPSSQLARAVDDLVRKAQKHFDYYEAEESTDGV